MTMELGSSDGASIFRGYSLSSVLSSHPHLNPDDSKRFRGSVRKKADEEDATSSDGGGRAAETGVYSPSETFELLKIGGSSSDHLRSNGYEDSPPTRLSPMANRKSRSGLLERRMTSIILANNFRQHVTSFFQVSDNKLSMKLFGNKRALQKEKMRQKAVGGDWVIHPCSNFRFYWDLFMLLLLLANLIVLPVTISFFNDDLSVQNIIFNSFSDTVFLIDIVINFRTGVIADNFADEIILDPKEIARHYFRSFFFLDLISSIPLDYILLSLWRTESATQIIHAGRALRMVRLVKLLSLLRLLRLSRLVRYVNQWQEFLAVAGKFMRFFNLVALMMLISHWNGCLQWLVPMLQDFPIDSWVALEDLQQSDWTEQYTWALFKALSHMLCIGYGRYPPQSTTDVWLTMVSMLIGATCYAMFVGHATTLIQSFDTSKRQYREKIKQTEEYMSYRKLPRSLRQRISLYYEHRYQGKVFHEKSILKELNDCLRQEIVNFNCRSLVASVPFFSNADPNFVSEVVTKLEFEVFQPEDHIIKEGTIGRKMYFIQEGVVDIVTKDGQVFTSLSDGAYFGEICLLTNAKRVADVRAKAYCNLFSLSVEHFNAVLDHFPEIRRTMQAEADARLNKIARRPSLPLTPSPPPSSENLELSIDEEISVEIDGTAEANRRGFMSETIVDVEKLSTTGCNRFGSGVADESNRASSFAGLYTFAEGVLEVSDPLLSGASNATRDRRVSGVHKRRHKSSKN